MPSTESGPRGLLLLNLGTPDAPNPPEVRRYLREFLMDRRVVDLNPVGRWLLVHLAILPTRPKRSAEAYRQVWMPEGSPLLVHSRALTQAVAQRLEGEGEFVVELGMRYGNPSIPSAIQRLKQRGARSLTVFPLYPQNAASSSSSSFARIYEVLAQDWEVLPLRVVEPFHHDPGFLDAFAQVARPVIAAQNADHVLFSFHGLPERQIRKSDPTGSHCLSSPGCCDTLTTANRTCYRAQSYATAREVAQRLGLPAGGWSVSFQSRLGRTPWIKPFTDHVLPALAINGVRRLAVVCPSFVSDCLETLEEIAIRAKEQFVKAGGESLELVPSLNAQPTWVDTVVRLARGGQGG